MASCPLLDFREANGVVGTGALEASGGGVGRSFEAFVGGAVTIHQVLGGWNNEDTVQITHRLWGRLGKWQACLSEGLSRGWLVETASSFGVSW